MTSAIQAFLTIVFNGGSIGWLLQKFKLTEADRLAGLDKKSSLAPLDEEKDDFSDIGAWK